MDQQQNQQPTTQANPIPVPPRRRFYYAVLETKPDYTDPGARSKTFIVQAETRNDLKRKLAEQGNNVKVLSVIQGREVKVSTSVALNFS